MADPVGRIGGATASAVRASRSTIDITEPALEIGFLAGHYAVTDDEREGHQHHQQPEIVERDGQADQTQEHAEVDGVAREAVRPLSTMVVVGRLVGTLEPALVIVTMAQGNQR